MTARTRMPVTLRARAMTESGMWSHTMIRGRSERNPYVVMNDENTYGQGHQGQYIQCIRTPPP